MHVRSFAAAIVLISAPALLAACASSDEHAGHGHAAAPIAAPAHAICHVMPTKGNAAHGFVKFADAPGGVHVTAVIEGLSPNGTHAIHIHEFGDISAPDAMSTGGHYNPDGHPHAGPDADKHHAGDFGNLQADANGRATLDLLADGLTVAGMKNPVIGRAIIVHAKADDFATQPTGNAGPRIATGVIGVAKAPETK